MSHDEIAALARERMQAEEQGSTLQASRAGQIPMFADKHGWNIQ